MAPLCARWGERLLLLSVKRAQALGWRAGPINLNVGSGKNSAQAGEVRAGYIRADDPEVGRIAKVRLDLEIQPG